MLTHAEKTFFMRAAPEFQRLIAQGEDPDAALAAACRGVLDRDEFLFSILIGARGRDLADGLKADLARQVYSAIRAPQAPAT